jgi:hypothetical protein
MGRQVPRKDHDGNIYGWTYDVQETGGFVSKLDNPTAEELAALKQAIAPGSKEGIHSALEILAQIKPIGSSDVKQATRISYLVFDLLDEGVSEFVVHEICRDYRKNAENRFFPDHSEFLEKARLAMNKYRSALFTEDTEKRKQVSGRVPDPDYPVGEERKRLADGFQKLIVALKAEEV